MRRNRSRQPLSTQALSRRRAGTAFLAAGSLGIPLLGGVAAGAATPSSRAAVSAGAGVAGSVSADAVSPDSARAGSSLASGPITTIEEPVAGAVGAGGRLAVRGRYSSTNPVSGVTVVACRPTGPTTCKDYLLASTNGAFAARWRGMPARMTPASADGRTGLWSVVLTGLPSTKLRIFAFATDSVTPKGAAAQVNAAVTASADPAYISIAFGRANWVSAGGIGCTNRPPTARTLEQNAIDLAEHGLPGVAQVVTSRVHETENLCTDNYALEASWADLARLRASYGWTLTSQSRTYPNLTTLDDAGVAAESTGSLPIFTAHGHDRAWGSFAYPNNKQDARVQAIVLRSFAFGRVYAAALNTRESATTFPYPMRTLSVNGGRCHNTALPCSRMAVANDRLSTSPYAIAKLLKPGPGKWGVVQFYRIVDGVESSLGMNLAWNCAAPKWEDRWTSQPEIFCRKTLLEALAMRNKSATAVDPATVALAWGRTPWR